MHRQPVQPSFNKDWAAKKTKAQFVDVHKAAYPDLDLGAEYDKIVPPKKEQKGSK